MSLASRWVVAHAESHARRAARDRRRTLRREIAQYGGDRDRADLEAILDRYPDGVTYEIRGILESEAWRRRA